MAPPNTRLMAAPTAPKVGVVCECARDAGDDRHRERAEIPPLLARRR